jgi:hypothetical protein
MSPESLAVVRVHAAHAIAAEDDELFLRVHVDQDWRCRGFFEVAGFPNESTRIQIESSDGLACSADGHNHRSFMQNRTARISAIQRGPAIFLDEVVGPQDASGSFVERENFAPRTGRIQAIADDQRSRVRPCAFGEIDAVGRCRIFVFPNCAARYCV